MPSITPFLDAISSVITLKKTEVILPIARKTSYVASLSVGDDLSIRTSVTSPVGYDRELIKLVHDHSEFVEEDKNVKLPYDQFCNELSNIDKLSMIWGLYKSTYDVLAIAREIKCPKCDKKFKIDIGMDELIHEDTFIEWDKADDSNNIIPFYKYRYPVSITHNDLRYDFNTRLPAIKDNNLLLQMIPIDVLQNNLQNTGAVFTKPQQIALLIDAMRLTSLNNSFEPVETSNINEILISLQSHVPYAVSEEFFEKFGEHFDKYVPNFYQNVVCPKCKGSFKNNIDLEVEFFRRSLFGRE